MQSEVIVTEITWGHNPKLFTSVVGGVVGTLQEAGTG